MTGGTMRGTNLADRRKDARRDQRKNPCTAKPGTGPLTTAAWTSDERIAAVTWAQLQIEANENLSGESISVAWPAHVSAAHWTFIPGHDGESGHRYPKPKKGRKRGG